MVRLRPAVLTAALTAALALAACAPASVPSSQAVQGDTLLVANKRGDTLTQVDLATGAVLRTVAACANPHELATSPDGAHVALACYGGTTLDIFRTGDLARVASIDVGAGSRPHGIVWHANGDLYATAEGRNAVVRVRDPLGEAEVFAFATGREGSHMLAVSPDARHAWTTDLTSKTVTRIDLVTRRAPLSVEVGIEPEGIALTPDGKTLWVSARGSDMAFALDPQTMEVRQTVAVGDFPLRLVIRPQGDVAVTSNLADTSLSVIDLARGTATRTIPLDDRANAMMRQQVTVLWSDDGERLYVAETGSDTVAEVDYARGTVLRRFTVGEGGDGLAILPGSQARAR